MADGSVKINIDLVKDKFSKALNDVKTKTKNTFDDMAKQADVSVGSVQTALSRIGTVTLASLGAMAGFGLKFNSDMEMYTSNFKVMLGSQEKALEKVEQLKEMAAKTPLIIQAA